MRRYLIVNYEHSNFSISQSLFKDNATPQIVAIPSVNDTSTRVAKTYQHQGLSAGSIAGIVIAVAVMAILAALAVFFINRRRSRTKAKEVEKYNSLDLMTNKPEMGDTSKPQMRELYAPEKDAKKDVEMEGDKPSYGLHGELRAEVEGSTGAAEMDGDQVAPTEMYAGPHGLYELPSQNPGSRDRPSPSTENESRTSKGLSWGRRQRPTSRLSRHESSQVSLPDTETEDRMSGLASWARRQRSPSRKPGTDNSDRSSPADPDGRRENGPDVWSARRQRHIPRNVTPQSVSSPTEESRMRRQKSADLLNRRLESISRSATPKEAISSNSPTEDSRGRNRHDRWNERFGSTPIDDLASPGGSERHRSGGNQSENVSGRGTPHSPGNFF